MTQTYEFEATLKWVKIYEPDEAFGSTRWLLNAYLTDDRQWRLFERSGLQLEPKEDEDGKYVVFRRDTEKKMKKDFVAFTPPFVYDSDGTPLVQYKDTETGMNVYSYDMKGDTKFERVGDPVMIGNGTLAKVRVSIYDTARGKGHRLENIKIVDLVEYSGGGSVITAENEVPGSEEPTTDFTDLDEEPNAEEKPVEEKKTRKTPAKKAKESEETEGDALPW